MAEQSNVPKWHAEFAERNAREHGELALEVARSEGRLIRWIAGLFIVQTGTLIAAIHFFT